MIHELEIQNFGCISQATVRLTPFHAFVGPNGSGKTTFLDAVQLMADLPRARIDDQIWHSVGMKTARLLARTSAEPNEYVHILVSKVPQGPFANEIIHMGQSGSMDVIRMDPADWIHKSATQQNSHGERVLKCLEMTRGLAAYGRTLLIDYPESYLYPGAIAKMVEQLRSLSEHTQVLITTHSPLVLNEMKPNEVTLVRKDGGWSVFTPIANTPNFLDRCKVYALGELWLSCLIDRGENRD